MTNVELNELGEKVIRRLLTARMGDDAKNQLMMAKWDWHQGVALYCLYQYYRQTGKTEYLDYIGRWFEDRIAGGLPLGTVRGVSLGTAIGTAKEHYLQVKQGPIAYGQGLTVLLLAELLRV